MSYVYILYIYPLFCLYSLQLDNFHLLYGLRFAKYGLCVVLTLHDSNPGLVKKS